MKVVKIIATVVLVMFPFVGEARDPQDGDRHRFRHGGSSRSSGFFRDRNTSGPGEAYRQFTQNELKNVPLLSDHLGSLGQIQQERYDLRRERNKVADDRSLRSDAALRKFHDLLRREDRLNERQRELFGHVVRDAEQIQKQIAERRQQIEKQLEGMPPPPDDDNDDTPPTPEETERRNLRRALRMYDYFNSRIGEIRENPDRADLLNRFTRGYPQGEDPSEARMVDHARRRLEEIQREQDDLEGKMKGLNEEVRELRKLLRSRNEGRSGLQRNDVSTTGTRRGGRGAR